jgi:iron complex outermembrane recepter protein
MRMIRKLAPSFLVACSAQVIAQTPEAIQQPAEDTQDEEIVVTGTVYRGEVSSGGARIDADVRDLPLSISVVPEAVIDDRQIRNLRELADNVAGVQSRRSGSGEFAIDFAVRGFQGFAGGLAVNGYRVDGFSAAFDPQAVERVEFLKGPGSVLYGASGALSGLVNVVTKTPQSDDFLTIDVIGGTPAYGRASFDANTQITGTLDARVTGSLSNEKILNAFRDTTAYSVNPSIRWRPADNLSLLAEANYIHSVQASRYATHYTDNIQFATLPKDFKISEPADRFESEGLNLRFEVNWEIAPGLILRQGINRQKYTDDELGIGVGFSGDPFSAGPRILERVIAPNKDRVNTTASQTELRWTFNALGMEHKLLAGYENYSQSFLYDCCDSAPIAPLDLDNPVYGTPLPDVPLVQFGGNRVKVDAGYVQDFIEWGQFRLLLGLRYDSVNSASFYCVDAACIGGRFPPAKEQAFSPRVGLVWQPNDGTTLYASFSKSFNPNPFPDRFGKLLPPERGIQYELGARQDLLSDGRLTLSLAAFDLTRRNVAEGDPVDTNFQVAIGEQRVKGLEAELTGKPTGWIDIVATYTYLDGEVTKSNFAITGIQPGSPLPEAAKHSGGIFTKLGLAPIGVEDVAFSVGAYYTASRPVRSLFFLPDPNFARLRATTRVDLGAYWDVSDTFRAQANITNLFDVRILEPSNIGFNRASPFRATLGGTFKF